MTSKKFFNSVVIFVLLFVFPLSHGLAEETSVKDGKSFFWRATSLTSTVYLLGSIHLAKKELYPLNPAIEEAFGKSSTLVVEVNTETIDEAKIQKEMMLKGLYAGEQTVKDSLNQEVFDMLKGFLEENGIPLQNMLKLKPGMLAMTLTSVQLMKLGFSPDHGIDVYFLKKAHALKPIIELESMEDQLSLFFDMPDENLFLKHTILSLHRMKQDMNDIMSAWNQGDPGRMNNLMLIEPLKEYPELLPIYERMFFDRNVKMTAKIRDLLKTKETYFIVVGCGHLIGEKGIIRLLQKAQYDICQL